jgi:quercetin dioxygenase-like cupin family protein
VSLGLDRILSSTIIPESKLSSRNHDNRKTTQFAQPVDILGLVSYQEGAVISRTLSNSESGTVTLFAFDQNQGLSEHTSPYDAFVQILEGSVEIFISGERMEATKGQIMTLPANQPHALNALSKFKMLLMMIHSVSQKDIVHC